MTRSKEIFLNVLAESHRQTSILVDELHLFDEEVIHPLTGTYALLNILDRSLEDLFVPYIDNSAYLDTEKDWLIARLKMEIEPKRPEKVLLKS
jgi:hypothetical protein